MLLLFSVRQIRRPDFEFRSREEYQSAIEVEPRLIDALDQDFLLLPVIGRVDRRVAYFCLAIDAISILAAVFLLFRLDYIRF
jgi:hypothetical protein